MSGQGILVILLVGLIAGWLAGKVVRGTGYGLVADICIGIVGALIGSWLFFQLGIRLVSGSCLFSQLGIGIGSAIIAAIISATVGAILLLIVLRLLKRGGRW